PQPASFRQKSMSPFSIETQTSLQVPTDRSDVLRHAKAFQNYLRKGGLNLSLNKSQTITSVIKFQIDESIRDQVGGEGYKLEIEPQAVMLRAPNAAGIFYGIQTLQQLLPPNFANRTPQDTSPISIPACTIIDFPRFQWRGLMLDVSRHFFPPEDVKAFIDQMAAYKFNTFHWHLTDDEGWRIEIKSRPRLTEVGAWRVERQGRFGKQRPYPKPGESATYGGFYTQEEIRDIVQYAADRHMTIIPEIDMPGHSMAALAAYPELSTKKEPKFVNPGAKFAEWYGNGKFKMLIENTLNPTDEAVYAFIDDVMTEVAALFPGAYIHMGGDECYKGYWEESAEVQAFMKEKEIKDSHELQAYFVGRVQEIIQRKGKKMIGWDEILEGGLGKDAAVMSWRGIKGGIEAAQKGHPVVMSPTTHAYLDYTQGDHSVENPIYNDLPLEQVYPFEPLPEGVNPQLILGGQGNLWTEVVPHLDFAFYMAYPRAFALAECLWSPKELKNWADFVRRTEIHFLRFEAAGKNICQAVYDPKVRVYQEGEKLMC
ncbi:MAG: beta-N-acetylhexosaminidase, partial [Bacteroidota bacterium]